MGHRCTVGNITIERANLRTPLAVIAGPCVLESLELGLTVGRTLRDLCHELGFAYIFKASFDKANRTSIDSPRGPGLDRGMEWMSTIRATLNVPLTTDIHEPDQADAVAQTVDLLQIPAFLARQTDLIVAAGEAAVRHKRAVNVKKGQFMSPQEMSGPIYKLGQTGCTNTMITERGTFFGYGRLVNDFIGVAEMMDLAVPGTEGQQWGNVPVCFDCTHSTQRPGAGTGGKVTGGNARMAPILARAAVAAGVDSLFIETHPNPPAAMSDAATQIPLAEIAPVLRSIAHMRRALAAASV